MSDFIVTEKAMRPASDERRCFYCSQDVGAAHRLDCVLITRKVKLRAIIEYDDKVPASWDDAMILFARNESSWCAGSIIATLETLEEKHGCLCPITEIEIVDKSADIYLDEK